MKRISLYILSIVVLAVTACTKADPDMVLQSITFEAKEMTLITGQTNVWLKPVFTPKAFDGINVQWSSADGSVATVSDKGIVSAKSRGETIVTVKDKNSATNGKIKIIVQ